MSDCNHSWAAVDSRRSQCRKCGEIAISPCRERECVAMKARIAELEAEAKHTRKTALGDGYERANIEHAGQFAKMQNQIDGLEKVAEAAEEWALRGDSCPIEWRNKLEDALRAAGYLK